MLADSRLPRRGAARLATAALLAPLAAAAAPVQWTLAAGGNGHWYEYVPAVSIFAPVAFDTARADALSRSHLGLPGYLATVTSAGEEAFIESSFAFLLGFGATGDAWLGASDAAVEGQWRWLDGPEAGQLLSYTDWLPGHPVDVPGVADYDHLVLHINAATAGAPPVMGWASKSGGALGYVIEYGAGTPPTAVPTPGTAALLGLALLPLAASRRTRAADRAAAHRADIRSA